MEAELSNANFEGADLGIQRMVLQLEDTFQVPLDSTKEELEQLFFPHDYNKSILGIAYCVNIPGVDLSNIESDTLCVDLYIFSNFDEAILKNANFANAKLEVVVFYDADLTGANLNNAILDNVALDGAILKCKNHSVCN